MICQVSDIFDVRYGHSLELNALTVTSPLGGVPFVSRKTGDNGVSAYVALIHGVEPAPAGDITCALGGAVLETYLQELPFYVGRDVAILRPKKAMSRDKLLFYCLCIKANRYRYSYGRQANKTLARLRIPSLAEIPSWVSAVTLDPFKDADLAANPAPINLPPFVNWLNFLYADLFEIERGKGPRKNTLNGKGITPFITSTDQNNGFTGYTVESPRHEGNVITVNRNGSVAEAFYQPHPFSSTEDVHVLKPKFLMNKYIAFFLIALIRQEKYRFNYGRKWGLGRMNDSVIKLPVQPDGQPDWELMESYVKALPYSVSL
jgi:Type I restriction modification DNA specificity domain